MHLREASYQLPRPGSSLSFNPNRLYASVARCNVLSNASGRVLFAQELAAKAALEDFVDDGGINFGVTDDVNDLGDAKLTSIAHDIGAGIANLYMDDMGYHWVANGKELLKSAGKKPDYVYDLGYVGSGYALMEAKGSVGKSVKKSDMLARVKKAYDKQVEPWLGSTANFRLLQQGYAIGTWARSGNDAEIIVHETEWPVAPAAVSVSGASPSLPLAFLNYAAVFQLVGAPNISSALRHVSLRRSVVDLLSQERLYEIRLGGRPFLRGRNSSYVWYGRSPVPSHDPFLAIESKKRYAFAIDLEIAKEVLSALRRPSVSLEERLELPQIPWDLLRALREEGRAALFADGLAYLPSSKIVGRWQWGTLAGLTREK